jgi:thiamine biosynthesis lipoprotein
VPEINSGDTELLKTTEYGDAMGATYSVVLYGHDRAEMDEAVNAAFAEAARLDALLSNYRATSEWSEVNRRAASEHVRVSPELFRLLSSCVAYSRESEGAFDIAVGPLMKLWGFYKGSGRLPSQEEVASILPNIGYQHIHLDADERTVRFDRSEVELDPGGIGKGYAVDCMVDILRQRGFQIALVAGSASTMYGMGAPPEEPEGWRVGIKDPRHAHRTMAEVFLKDMSLATSGSYEKFFRAEGKSYAHIMDPRTGFPALESGSVSVVAPRAIDSEAWAKPYFINGRQWAAAHKPEEFRVLFCDGRADEPCAWIADRPKD